MPSSALPPTMRALQLSSQGSPLTLQTLPTPLPAPGSAIVRILSANVISYSREIYNGARKYPYPTPLIPGASSIGRIASVGPDATLLKEGDLVLIEVTLHGRDDPSATCLIGIHEGFTAGSKKLMQGEWRDATYAEYAKIPLENCVLLNEKVLLGDAPGWGYSIDDLAQIPRLLVPFGGLRDIDVRVGETVIVAPATGAFSGAAVQVALAMGARVIAVGRKKEKLEKLKEVFLEAGVEAGSLETVTLTGDVEKDTAALRAFGEADALFDISPPEAASSTHFKSAIGALRRGGRVSVMGGGMGNEDLCIPNLTLGHMNLTVKGKLMYEREDILALLKMVDRGILKLGEGVGLKTVGAFGLEDWEKAFDLAAEKAGFGENVVLKP